MMKTEQVFAVSGVQFNQPPKTEVPIGVAVRVTVVPEVNVEKQAPGPVQLMPCGELVT